MNIVNPTRTRSDGDPTIAGPATLSRADSPLADLIRQQISRNEVELATQFHLTPGPVQCRYAVLDNLLPDELCRQIHAAFPPVERMRFLNTFRERKYTSKAVDAMDPLIGQALFAFQSPGLLELISRITGIHNLQPDPSLYAGGISAMTPGQFLNPHLDNSHEASRRWYRRLNLLYYVTPDWQPDGGGNLELWDPAVRRTVEIPSVFNRLVIMETNRRSWHSVNMVRQPAIRRCVSNYYFTAESPEADEYFHVTTFSARPEQPLARACAAADNWLRTAVRWLKRDGLGKTDVYQRGVHDGSPGLSAPAQPIGGH